MERSQQEIDRLIMAAQARIDTAISQLLLATKGVTDASAAQQVAIAELKAAREAVTVVREVLSRAVAK